MTHFSHWEEVLLCRTTQFAYSRYTLEMLGTMTTLPSNGSPLRGVQACVFDAYGTLFDFAAAARKCRDKLGDDIDKLTALWRDKQLQYTWLRTAQGRHADFWQVTGDALDFEDAG